MSNSDLFDTALEKWNNYWVANKDSLNNFKTDIAPSLAANKTYNLDYYLKHVDTNHSARLFIKYDMDYRS